MQRLNMHYYFLDEAILVKLVFEKVQKKLYRRVVFDTERNVLGHLSA
jgi:hypothetical protein